MRITNYGEWCSECSSWQSANPEFVPESIKDDRRKYLKDIVQPFRNGELSKEFVESNPKEAKRYASDKEISKAKYVWKDLPSWEHHYGKRS